MYIELTLEQGWSGATHAHLPSVQCYHQGTLKQCPTPKWALAPQLTLTTQQGWQQFTAHASSPWTTESTGSLVKTLLNLSKTTYLPTRGEKRTLKTAMASPDGKYQRWGWQQHSLVKLSSIPPFSELLSTVTKHSLMLKEILGISTKTMHIFLKVKPSKSTFHCPSSNNLASFFF